ncbi:MAG: hypothetical protein WCI20_05845 [bacterium]
MKYLTITVLLFASLAGAVHAADPAPVTKDAPDALAICCHDAVRWIKMNPPDPKNASAALVRTTDKEGKPLPEVVEPLFLYLSLDRSSGKVRQGFAAAEVIIKKRGDKRSSTEKVQAVEVQGLTWNNGRLSGKLSVTVGPQGFAWGQLYPAACTLELDVTPGADGTYQGRYGDFEVKGKATCETMTTPDLSKSCETTLYLHDAVSYRNMGGGGASCGGFAASWKDGKITACAMGDCYGYNIWDMTILDASGLTLSDGKLTGVLVGKQTSTYNPGQAGDISWTIDAVVVGKRVLGTGKAIKTPSPEIKKKKPVQQYDIAINGLIANTADIPDVKTWRLDHAIRVRAEAGEESYWHGRNPNKTKNESKSATSPSTVKP